MGPCQTYASFASFLGEIIAIGDLIPIEPHVTKMNIRVFTRHAILQPLAMLILRYSTNQVK